MYAKTHYQLLNGGAFAPPLPPLDPPLAMVSFVVRPGCNCLSCHNRACTILYCYNILHMRNLCDFVFRCLQSYLCKMMAVLAPPLTFTKCIKCYENSLLLCIGRSQFCPVSYVNCTSSILLAGLLHLTFPFASHIGTSDWPQTSAVILKCCLFCHLCYPHKVENIYNSCVFPGTAS